MGSQKTLRDCSRTSSGDIHEILKIVRQVHGVFARKWFNRKTPCGYDLFHFEKEEEELIKDLQLKKLSKQVPGLLWLSFSLRLEQKKYLGLHYADKDKYKDNAELEDFLSKWVLSEAFEQFFTEPMNEILFQFDHEKEDSVPSRRPFSISRFGNITFYEPDYQTRDFHIFSGLEKVDDLIKQKINDMHTQIKAMREHGETDEFVYSYISQNMIEIWGEASRSIEYDQNAIEHLYTFLKKCNIGNTKEGSNIAETVAKACIWNRLTDFLYSANPVSWKMIVYIPDSFRRSDSCGFVCALNFEYVYTEHLWLLSLICKALVGFFFHKWDEAKQIRANTQSAIGSIMSRNGSHNIGSHVLSALSHKAETMPDDRVLYQYIQQRMDYIATVTTEFPNWTGPTRFVSNLMKTFLSQRHLLEHISESEGLGAWHFRGRQITTDQKAKIKIHVRNLEAKSGNGKKEKKDFILYSGQLGKNQEPRLSDDVSLAIPGGTVGQHAFYTILENIIRNAAKHGWSKRSNDSKETNLEIHIDFREKAESCEVEFTIWDNMSDVFALLDKDSSGKYRLTPSINESMGSDEPKEWQISELERVLTQDEVDKLREAHSENIPGKKRVNYDKLPQHWKQQVLLDQPLINDQGELRRENWGLAEMRISAGYLQRRDIGEIGGIAESKKKDIITPVAVKEETGETATYHLGYRFTIPKPKKLLIVKPDGNDWNDILSDGKKEEMEKAGIYIKSTEEINQGGKNSNGYYELDYEYVVLPESKESFKEKKWLFPFRLLLANTSTEGKKLSGDVVDYAELKGLINGSDSNGDKARQIKKLVYEAWLAAIKSRVKTSDTIYLQVQAGSGASGGGKGLMRDSDLYRIVFRECGHSVMLEATKEQQNKTAKLLTTLLAATPLDQESFLPDEDGEESRVHIRKQLQHFCERFKRELRLGSRSGTSVNQDFVDSLRILYRGSNETISADNLSPFEQAFLRNLQLDLRGDSGLAKNRVKTLIRHLVETDQDKLNAALDVFCGQREPSEGQSLDSGLGDIFDNVSDPSSMLKKNIELLFTPADSDTSAEFGKLVDKLNSAYQTSDIFLRKYEEDIPTLPKIRWAKKESSNNGDGLDKVSIFKTESPANHTIIRYVRHDNTTAGFYAEALSGSQSYLNALDQFELKNIDFTVRLVENALLRVLIVDERVCNFFATRPEELYSCRKMRIFAGDFTMAEAKQPARAGFEKLDKDNKTNFGIAQERYDILIIHQGVIDKWCSAHDKKTVDNLLKSLEKVVPFVVVTTGRGRPDNIPEDARVLPFTSVESTIFRKYPEKLVLVNTVMNILPNGKEDSGKGTGS